MNKTSIIDKKHQYKESFRMLLYSGNFIFDAPDYLTKSERFALFFLSIESSGDLCAFFKIHHIELENLVNYPKYNSYLIAKKKKGVREINAPVGQLKQVQKKINQHLQGVYSTIRPHCSNGFILKPSKNEMQPNIIENAKPHVGKNYVLNMDIKDFFSSISSKQIFSIFRNAPFDFNTEIAKALTFLTTFNNCLPQGAPSSPILSNFACLKLDQQLSDFAIKNNMSYTRYADDLTFSSNNQFTSEHIISIEKFLKHEGFESNKKKFRIRSSNKKQIVTGLIVNDKVNVDRKMMRLVRAILYDLEKNGIKNAAAKHYKISAPPTFEQETKFIQKISGLISFIQQIRGKDDKKSQQFKRQLECFLELQK